VGRKKRSHTFGRSRWAISIRSRKLTGHGNSILGGKVEPRLKAGLIEKKTRKRGLIGPARSMKSAKAERELAKRQVYYRVSKGSFGKVDSDSAFFGKGPNGAL